jgi:hypothetical protein
MEIKIIIILILFIHKDFLILFMNNASILI